MYKEHPNVGMIVSDWMVPGIDESNLCRCLWRRTATGC